MSRPDRAVEERPGFPGALRAQGGVGGHVGAPHVVIALLVATLAVLSAAAGHADEGDVDPDRPSVTNSARTVSPGAVQIESGLEYARTSRGGSATERRFGVEVLGRFGVAERFEVQLGWEPLVHLRGPEDDTGIGDVTLSLKYQVSSARSGSPWPSLGIQPFAKLPSADEPISSGRPDFGLVGLASFDLPAGLGLDVNAGVAAIGQSRPNGYVLQALTSAALSIEIGAVAPFVEVFYRSRDERDGGDAVGLDVGLVYRLTTRLAVDGAVETTLAGAGPDWAVRAGLSVRFGK